MDLAPPTVAAERDLAGSAPVVCAPPAANNRAGQAASRQGFSHLQAWPSLASLRKALLQKADGANDIEASWVVSNDVAILAASLLASSAMLHYVLE